MTARATRTCIECGTKLDPATCWPNRLYCDACKVTHKRKLLKIKYYARKRIVYVSPEEREGPPPGGIPIYQGPPTMCPRLERM